MPLNSGLFRRTALTGVLLFMSSVSSALVVEKPEEVPEIDEIQALTTQDHAPTGVLFTIMETDEEALEWILPRLLYYTQLLRDRFEGLPLAVISHGDEILALTIENSASYHSIHQHVKHLVEELGIDFHVCGTFAQFSGLSDEDFPVYIDVVPFGPASINDYRAVGYEVISMELVW